MGKTAGPRTLVSMAPELLTDVWGPSEWEELTRRAEVVAPAQPASTLRTLTTLLEKTEVLVTGWDGPRLDAGLLCQMPRLRLVLHAAGSVRPLTTDAFWERGIPIVSAYAANAVPVAEFTVAQIHLALKHAWRTAIRTSRARDWERPSDAPGAYGSVVGIVSLGAIGRMVAQRLGDSDLRVLAYDPYASEGQARACGARKVTLPELFTESDVISVHAPSLPETRGLIDRPLLHRMKRRATLLNTARGAVVDEDALSAVMRERPDLFALLDVTDPEPPSEASALWDLPNIVLTPHIAGSQGPECRRMARLVLAELDRFLAGQRLHWRVTREQAELMT